MGTERRDERAYSERFTGRAKDYSKYRPGYPQKVLTILTKEVGLNRRWEVADVGSGTGKLSELFLQFGNRVYCVEPNDEMRLTAEKALGSFPGFVSVAGRAEATGLGPHSIDLIVVGQALHWFDFIETRTEFARILRKSGYVSIVCNNRRAGGAVARAYSELVRRHAKDRAAVPEVNDESVFRFLGAKPRKFTVPNVQRLSISGLSGRLASASYMPPRDSAEWAAIREDARQLILDHGVRGAIELHYDTTVYLGRIAAGQVSKFKMSRRSATS